MQRDYKLFLNDMLDAAIRITQKIDGKSLGDLEGNPDLRDIIQLNLIKLGEAAKMVPKEIRDTHPEIDWRRAAGMRDRLTHGYFGVKWELVLRTVQTDLPPLIMEIKKMMVVNESE